VYVYNAFGQRVEKQTGSAYTEIVYDALGSAIGLHNRTGWDTYFVPFGGRPFVRYQDSKRAAQSPCTSNSAVLGLGTGELPHL
jgi:hypothetical protein